MKKSLDELKAELEKATNAVPIEAREEALHHLYDAITNWLDAVDGEDEAEIDAALEARESTIEALVEADYQYSKAITIWGKLNDQVEKREHPEGLTKPPRGGWLRDRKPEGNA
jgi:uncharacterized damage-inducible protein DinB